MESGCTHSDVSLHSSLSVLKYRKNDEDESLKDKLSKLNIHSISKKSKRVTNHLKILTRGESQVIFLLGPPMFPRGSLTLPVVGALALLFLWPCLKHRIKVVPQALPCAGGGGWGVTVVVSALPQFPRGREREKRTQDRRWQSRRRPDLSGSQSLSLQGPIFPHLSFISAVKFFCASGILFISSKNKVVFRCIIQCDGFGVLTPPPSLPGHALDAHYITGRLLLSDPYSAL